MKDRQYQGCGSVWYGSGSSIFGRIPIRIQSGFGSNADPDPIRIQGFVDQKLKKIYSWKKKFRSKTTICLSLVLQKGRPSYKKSLQFSKENIQYFKTWNFYNFVLLLWVIFALLDLDLDSEYGYGSTDPIESGSNPDPQSWTILPPEDGEGKGGAANLWCDYGLPVVSGRLKDGAGLGHFSSG